MPAEAVAPAWSVCGVGPDSWLSPANRRFVGGGFAPPSTAADVVLDRFGCYLTGERALTVPVARAYCHWVRPSVEEVLRANDIGRLRGLTAGDVTRFLATRLPNISRKSAQMTACALRSLLRFLHREALVEVSLADAVPAIASWRLSGYPRHLPPQRSRRSGLAPEAVFTVRTYATTACTHSGLTTTKNRGHRPTNAPITKTWPKSGLIPGPNFCFDCLKSASTLGLLVEAHLSGRVEASIRACVDDSVGLTRPGIEVAFVALELLCMDARASCERCSNM
jgi:hypothetical protein